jgi:hypothetical protein
MAPGLFSIQVLPFRDEIRLIRQGQPFSHAAATAGSYGREVGERVPCRYFMAGHAQPGGICLARGPLLSNSVLLLPLVEGSSGVGLGQGTRTQDDGHLQVRSGDPLPGQWTVLDALWQVQP